MKPSEFKRDYKFFHLNMSYESTGYFKELDWIQLQKMIALFAQKFSIEIHALVMMDTHFHILIKSFTKKENFFCSELHRHLNSEKDFDSHCEPIYTTSQYLNTYKYIYNNPVKAGLCLYAEDYRYSSIYTLLGRSVNYCLIADYLRLIQNPHHILKWLNSDIDYKFSKINHFA